MMRRDTLMNELMDMTMEYVAITDGGLSIVECNPDVPGIELGNEIEIGGIPEEKT